VELAVRQEWDKQDINFQKHIWKIVSYNELSSKFAFKK
jgi:hypothetical protein